MAVKPVEAVVLDLGEVMLRLDFSRLLAGLGLGKGGAVGLAIPKLNRWELFDTFERGKMGEDEFRSRLGEKVGRELSVDEFEALWNSVIVGTIPGTEEILRGLSARLPTYAVTNTSPTHWRYCLATFPWLGHFRRIFTSTGLGLRKPERALYAAVTREIGAAPGGILFVDDVPENVTAAREAGWRAEVIAESPRDLVAALRKHGVTGTPP